MKLTGALLAESVQSVDGKLDLRGGMVQRVVVGPDRTAVLTLVVLVEFAPGDVGPVITLVLITTSGDSQTRQMYMPVVGSPDEIGFAWWPLWFPVEEDGKYRLAVSADQGATNVPLTVLSG